MHHTTTISPADGSHRSEQIFFAALVLCGGSGRRKVFFLNVAIQSAYQHFFPSNSLNEAAGRNAESGVSGTQPDNWGPDGMIDYFYDEINEIAELQKSTRKEHGFAAIWNHGKKEMRASEIVSGKEEGVFLSAGELMERISFEKGDVVIGIFSFAP